MKTLTALALLLALAGCSSDAPPPGDRCLYEAVQAYPSWDPANGSLLDHIDSCEGASKTEIRELMAAFVAAANTNLEGK